MLRYFFAASAETGIDGTGPSGETIRSKIVLQNFLQKDPGLLEIPAMGAGVQIPVPYLLGEFRRERVLTAILFVKSEGQAVLGRQ